MSVLVRPACRSSCSFLVIMDPAFVMGPRHKCRGLCMRRALVMTDRCVRLDRRRSRARRLRRRDPRGAARHAHRDHRAIVSRRHLPQLGLHSDQGAASLGRGFARGADGGCFRHRRAGRASRSRRGRRALARSGGRALHRRRLPAQEEQRRCHLGRGASSQVRVLSTSRKAQRRSALARRRPLPKMPWGPDAI